MGSADMMQRNLNGRVETLTPVVDPRLKARIEEVLEILLEDDNLAWEMTEGGESWARVVPTSGVNAHERLQALALERIVAP
jgi:polyphosphate kinase